MASPHLTDAIRDPSRIIINLYEERGDAEVDFPAQVTSHFATIFRTPDSIQQIPPLSLNYPPDAHPDRSLVRFYAMIQDTPSPEMYLSRLPGGECGGWNLYQDQNFPNSMDIDLHSLRECSIFWAITVPGESQWHAQRLEGAFSDKASKIPSRTPYLTNHRHKLPNPQSADFGILLKIYDRSLTKDLKPMTTATFVGILTLESIETEAGVDAVILPVLHVTYMQMLTSEEIPSHPSGNSIIEVYENLVDWVSQEALAGDRDAAELTILCSVARVYSRNPPILPPSLQLTGFPSPDNSSPTPAICSVLSKLLPFVSVVGLSLGTLNSDRFTPESNGEDLSSGYLQVPVGSVMILTETGIAEGNIIEKGVCNLKDVQDVMNEQSLRYTFPFSQFFFNTEIGFILLVGGRQSPFFTTDISLPLQPQNKDTSRLYRYDSEINLPDQDQLDAFRNLLSGARRRERLRVPTRLAELIEHEFVEERKREGSVTPHDLTIKITIARLLGLLFQADELSVELWERAKQLEARRKKRYQV